MRERSPCTDYEERNDEKPCSIKYFCVIRNVRKRQKCSTSTLLKQLYKQRENKKNIEMQVNSEILKKLKKILLIP